MTALLLCALLQDPLDVDDIEVRQGAAADLVRQGEAALPGLYRRHAEAADPELRGRLAEVIGRVEADVRSRGFSGGGVTGGLKARLVRIEDADAGRPAFRLEIMNVSGAPRPFLVPALFDQQLPGLSATTTASHGALRVKRLEGEGSSVFRGRRACGGGPQGTIERLKPGASREIPIACTQALEPGVYEASVRYYAARLLPGVCDDLVSDAVRFEVRP